ncbi:uncharacterized protein THITE_2120409 [Thermothielavioides terrestris NRRL 8126]|uniref:Uncharacterized protein n=1 Tax=Thermothielavioides terrestris (strain ATCC 38088 / NRRL 8126) TaxID=578455 RepID=G2RAH9_THETT|nr:uncharacterized protein THITE_2120409 [Thermothielavioides terrestris NRRL 8126]AEO69714.1 hypothetical protein THITE_2120409 [Thermothielavioides terrestris NRRL 8126]
MAPSRQHTFTLVPNPLGVQGLMSRPASGPESKPPMTSKQAQKLYRQATRGPRLSKAEQRRIEREEQERIRRELAKDKQAAKARALREKKKAKEQQVLEEKRRRGLPLVDVRPSQDTISRFVRGNGAGKKRDATGTKVDLPTVEEEPDDIDRPRTEDGLEKKTSCEQGATESQSKRQCLDVRDVQEGNNVLLVRGVGSPVPAPAPARLIELPESGKSSEHADYVENEPKILSEEAERRTTATGVPGNKVEQNSTTAETVESQGKTTSGQVRAPGNMPAPEISNTHPGPSCGKLENTVGSGSTNTHGRPAPETPASALSIHAGRQGTPTHGFTGQCIRAPTTTIPQPLTGGLRERPMPQQTSVSKQMNTPRPPLNKPDPKHPQQPSAAPQSARKPLQETTNAQNRATKPESTTANAAKAASPRRPTPMASNYKTPPTVPAFKQPTSGLPTGERQKLRFPPRFLSPHSRQPPARQQAQQKRQDNCEPAVPTSTQLFIVSHIDLFPTPSQEARELQEVSRPVSGPSKPAPSGPSTTISAPGPHPRRFTRQVGQSSVPMAPPPRPVERQVGRVNRPMAPPPRPAVKTDEPIILPFISTQDLVLSSQEVRELEEPTPSRSRMPKPPPFKIDRPTTQRRPSPLPYSPSRTAVHHAAQSRAKHPPLADDKPQQRAGGHIQAAPKHHAAAGDRSGPANDGPLPKPLGSGAAAPQQAAEPAEALRRSPGEKPRFFGSSGEGVQVLLAINRSRQTYEEEERKRVAEREAQASRQDHQPGHQSLASQRRGAVAASQETDYGDLELDTADLDDLDPTLLAA